MGFNERGGWAYEGFGGSPEISSVVLTGRFKRDSWGSGIHSSATLFIKIGSNYYSVNQSSGLVYPFNPVANNPWGSGANPHFLVTTSWVNYSITFTADPSTTKKWKWSVVNSMQLGVGLRRAHTTQFVWTYCTQTFVTVNFVGGSAILRPNGAGDVCGIPWQTGAVCPNHFQNVDEIIPDENVTLVYSTSDPGFAYDLYYFQNAPYS